MPRLAMSPAETFRRQDEALRLLRAGVGVRAVAREVGCSPSSVVRWRDAQTASPGELLHAGRRWDVHGTAGERWEATAKQRARSAAFRARAREARQLGARPPAAHDAPLIVAERERLFAEPAPWENEVTLRRAQVRLSMNAFVVTKGRAHVWDSAALAYAFEARPLDAVPVELYRSTLDRERAALALLEASARRAGFVQDRAGIWHLPAGADEG